MSSYLLLLVARGEEGRGTSALNKFEGSVGKGSYESLKKVKTDERL